MKWDDDHVDQIIGTLLRAGVILAASVVFMGGVWFLLREGGSIPNYRQFRGEPERLRSVTMIVRTAFEGRPRSLIQFGLLLLIATPVVRVAFSVFAFAAQRDRLYIAITLLVLAVLLSSLFGITSPPH